MWEGKSDPTFRRYDFVTGRWESSRLGTPVVCICIWSRQGAANYRRASWSPCMPRSSYCAWTQPRVTCTTWMTRGWQIPATRDGWASEDVSLRVQALVIGTAELEGLELCRSGAATHAPPWGADCARSRRRRPCTCWGRTYARICEDTAAEIRVRQLIQLQNPAAGGLATAATSSLTGREMYVRMARGPPSFVGSGRPMDSIRSGSRHSAAPRRLTAIAPRPRIDSLV